MPTTDPGSDLLFSTDDEYIDANGIVTCYGTMPPRIRRNLLKSELQRRYIEEIGDGLRNMPPELIITSPSNKGKQSKHSVRILYKPAAGLTAERKLQTNELPFIGQPAKRTSSWHNLNTAGQSPTLTPYKSSVNKNKTQSPFYRPLSKKEPLTKEDLDIKLSLKKKIWTGIQPDDISLGIDRTRPLSWVAPQSLKSKKMTDQNLNSGLHLAKLSSGNNNIKRLENEAFLTACSQKLMEWKIMNTNLDESSPRSQKTKMPLKLVVPDINEDHTMCIFKHLVNIKNPTTPNSSTKAENEVNTKTKTKRATISKVVETSKIFTKMTKSKSRNNLTTSQRALNKQTGTQHKSHTRSNKFKTGGLVVTAVQTGVSNGAAGAKKNKKLKSLQNKLPNTGANLNTNNLGCGGTEAHRRPSTQNGGGNAGSGGGLVMAATATTIVRKVKTKLKKKKMSTNAKQESTTSLNANL